MCASSPTRSPWWNSSRLPWYPSCRPIPISTSISRSGRAGRSCARFAEGYGDIGIVADPVDPVEELEIFPFAEDRLVLIVPRRHALSRHREIAFRDCLDHDFV